MACIHGTTVQQFAEADQLFTMHLVATVAHLNSATLDFVNTTSDPSLFADNAPGYIAVLPTDVPAKEVFPGVNIQVLWQGDNGATAAVVDIAAGAKWGKDDVHAPGPEEVYVVSGTFNDGQRDYPAGTFMHAPAHSWHIPQSEEGCVLFVFYPEG